MEVIGIKGEHYWGRVVGNKSNYKVVGCGSVRPGDLVW
jgi:hypothetical protein